MTAKRKSAKRKSAKRKSARKKSVNNRQKGGELSASTKKKWRMAKLKLASVSVIKNFKKNVDKRVKTDLVPNLNAFKEALLFGQRKGLITLKLSTGKEIFDTIVFKTRDPKVLRDLTRDFLKEQSGGDLTSDIISAALPATMNVAQLGIDVAIGTISYCLGYGVETEQKGGKLSASTKKKWRMAKLKLASVSAIKKFKKTIDKKINNDLVKNFNVFKEALLFAQRKGLVVVKNNKLVFKTRDPKVLEKLTIDFLKEHQGLKLKNNVLFGGEDDSIGEALYRDAMFHESHKDLLGREQDIGDATLEFTADMGLISKGTAEFLMVAKLGIEVTCKVCSVCLSIYEAFN